LGPSAQTPPAMEPPAETLSKPVLGRTMIILGWLCAVAILWVFYELARMLPWVTEWWSYVSENRNAFQMGDPTMWVDLSPVAMVASLGYWGGVLFLVTAIVKAPRAKRQGLKMNRAERIVLEAVSILLIATWALHHLTPLSHAWINILVF
jgi:hypothetical protein